MSPKRPKTRFAPPAELRHPKTLVKPGPDYGGHLPTFSFRYADRVYSGSWCWPKGPDVSEMLEFLCEMSHLTWKEILQQTSGGHRKHHAMPFSSLVAEAQTRIAELRHDEIFEELFRFRLAGTKRLWGYRHLEVFYILWWDAQHRVYPQQELLLGRLVRARLVVATVRPRA
jgi:hypothetical protein